MLNNDDNQLNDNRLKAILMLPTRKRGRPRKNSDKQAVYAAKGDYFVTAEEYIPIYNRMEDTKEKNKIYEKYINAPLFYMIQTVLYTYFYKKGYPIDIKEDEIIQNTMVYVIENLHRYDSSKGFKAYSYFQTIIKHYIQSLFENFYRKDYEKKISMNIISHEIEETDIENNEEKEIIFSFFNNIIKEIKIVIQHPEKYNLNSKEVLIGNCIANFMGEWENIYGRIGSHKFNKDIFILYIKERTFLDDSVIKEGIKKFKQIYIDIKKEFFK